jgi:capsule polysaccharide export protein KpsE/RkpR
MTVILNEDLRNRTSRASETSKFLERESKRLQAELNAVDTQIGELRKAAATTTRPDLEAATQVALDRHRVFVDETNAQIANLKAERLSKANRLTWNHPEVQAIHRKIASLERAIAEPPALPKPAPEQEKRIDPVLENLQQRQETLQENFAQASTKLAAAQLGEALERDQFAERLEVIEQPTRPQAPIRPKRLKLLALVLALAVAAGAGLVVLTEALDGTIRGRADLVRLVDGYLIVPIPMVENARDRRLRKFRIIRGIGVCLLLLAGAATAAHFFLPPPDILWQEASARFTRYIVR